MTRQTEKGRAVGRPRHNDEGAACPPLLLSGRSVISLTRRSCSRFLINLLYHKKWLLLKTSDDMRYYSCRCDHEVRHLGWLTQKCPQQPIISIEFPKVSAARTRPELTKVSAAANQIAQIYKSVRNRGACTYKSVRASQSDQLDLPKWLRRELCPSRRASCLTVNASSIP